MALKLRHRAFFDMRPFLMHVVGVSINFCYLPFGVVVCGLLRVFVARSANFSCVISIAASERTDRIPPAERQEQRKATLNAHYDWLYNGRGGNINSICGIVATEK